MITVTTFVNSSIADSPMQDAISTVISVSGTPSNDNMFIIEDIGYLVAKIHCQLFSAFIKERP